MHCSFAPELTSDKLDSFREISADHRYSHPQIWQEMLRLIAMVDRFRETPDSKLPAFDHPIGVLGSTGRVPRVTPLEAAEIERISSDVPWSDECDRLAALFAGLQGDIKHAANHLLWFARELRAGREPITQNKL
jgi:hypothetical protein